MAKVRTFLANHPKFAANYNQLNAADQGRWQNKFQQGGAQAVKPFTQNRLAQQQAPKVANVGTYQPMQQQIQQPQAMNTQQFQPMQPRQYMPAYQKGFTPGTQQSFGTQQIDMAPRPTGFTGTPDQFQRYRPEALEAAPQTRMYQMGGYAQQPQQFSQQLQQIQPQGWVQDPATGQWRRG